MARRGRIHELRLMGTFNLRRGKPFANASLAPKLFFKGRLGLRPPRRNRRFKKWMKTLWR